MKKPTHIVIRETSYYETGPQQGRPPEGELKKGTLIIILNPSDSYPRVQTEDGSVTAYILAKDITLIKPVSD